MKKHTFFALILFFGVFLIFGCGLPSKPKTVTENPLEITAATPKILALGDSLTEGYRVDRKDSYPSQLQKFLLEKGKNYEVINSGSSGETTTGLRERIDWVLSQDPDIIILTSGANDAMRGIDLQITEKNLAYVIERIQEKGIVLVFSGMQIYENLGSDYVNQFKNLYPKLAQKYNLPFIPFFLAGVAGDKTLNTSDGIHPNAAGYKKIIEENIWPVLAPILGE